MTKLTKEKIIEIIDTAYSEWVESDVKQTFGESVVDDILAELAGQESTDKEKCFDCKMDFPIMETYFNWDTGARRCWTCQVSYLENVIKQLRHPAKAEAKTGKCDCQVWEGIDRNGFCRICGGEPRSILSYTESEPVKDEAKKKPDHHNDIYGPGDDNYGRNKPFWKAEAKTAEEVLNEVQGGFERITYQIAIRAMKIYASQQPTKETKGMTPEEFF